MAKPPLAVSGDAARYNHRDGNDDFTQPGNRFHRMTPEAQQRLCGNNARHMAEVPREIQLPKICRFFRADPACGAGAAHALGIDLEKEMARLGISGNGSGNGAAGHARRSASVKLRGGRKTTAGAKAKR